MSSESPQKLFDEFNLVMSTYRGFRPVSIPFSGYECYQHGGMHDPPPPKRVYSKVLGRKVHEIGFSGNGFMVQVDLLDVPGRAAEQAAVFLRSKSLPKPNPTANATFKFARDDNRRFVMDFHARAVRDMLKSFVPTYLTQCHVKDGRLLLNKSIDEELVHSLLLATDFAAQATRGKVVPRDPSQYFPPA